MIDEAPVPEVNNDYELVYTDDGTGNNVWWLYNHIDNTREKLQELLDYADSQANKTASLTSANQKLKIVSIVLGALLAVAVIAIIILAIKLGSGGYEYDDDDDEDEDDEEDVATEETLRPHVHASVSAPQDAKPNTKMMTTMTMMTSGPRLPPRRLNPRISCLMMTILNSNSSTWMINKKDISDATRIHRQSTYCR